MADTAEQVTEGAEDEAADAAEEQEEERPQVTELLARLGRELGVLAFLETQLAVGRNMPEVRRVARDVAGAVVAALAFLTAFVFVNVAVLRALEGALSPWLAALVLGLAWVVVGVALAVALMVRAGQVTGWKWWRVFTAGPEEVGRDLESARTDAEAAVRETLGQLAPAISLEIASAALPVATGMAEGVVDAGEGILEASDDIVEAIADELPGGSVVNQIWDVVLIPGRFGVRVATTVLRRAGPTA